MHQDMHLSVMNVVDGLNAHAGDTWQESDVASQARWSTDSLQPQGWDRQPCGDSPLEGRMGRGCLG